MSPHGNEAEDTGSPRCVFHTIAPVNRSTEYTVLFSVATMTCPLTTSGDAYTSPSNAARHATVGVPNPGSAGPRPERPASRWYSVHSVEIGGDGEGVLESRGDDDDRPPPEEHAATRTTRARRTAGSLRVPRRIYGMGEAVHVRARSARRTPASRCRAVGPSRPPPSRRVTRAIGFA